MKNKKSELDIEIVHLLTDLAEDNCEHQSIWIDADAITLVILETNTRAARRLVRQRLRCLLSLKMVERHDFEAGTGWKLVENITVISD